MNITFNGNNALVFVGDRFNYWINGSISITTNGLCYIGKNSSFGGTNIYVLEGKNIIFGNDCMFSWEIWLRSGDSHMIYDSKTHQRANFSKSIYIGPYLVRTRSCNSQRGFCGKWKCAGCKKRK